MKRLQWVLALLAVPIFAGTSVANVPESPFNKDPWPAPKEGPVKVFILAGQSNMQGHASLRTLEYLIYNKETAKEYEQWKKREGGWAERSDVWVWTTDQGGRHGKLTPGFGGNAMEIGPELGFGWVMGEHMGSQVLLIKTCWGGRSVKRDFLSPGSALPSDEQLKVELERARKRRPKTTMDDIKARYGKAYRDTVAHVNEVLGDLRKYFPTYDEKRGYELAGLVFFQGWNDLVDGSQRGEKYVNYTKRLGQMIKDLRRDLKAPNLPVVIGELGVGGKVGDFQKAQAAVTELPGLKGNVKLAKTTQFWDAELEKVCKAGVWHSPQWVSFYNHGSQEGYHYLGSAKILYSMGKAFAGTMIELLGK